MKIYTVVVTYDGEEWIEKCIRSLQQSTVVPAVIVIDNASNDNTVKVIRENFPTVHLVEGEKNIGFGQANNIGFRIALQHEADYIFLLNQDAWVNPDTLEKLASVASSNPAYGILSPFHLSTVPNVLERQFIDFLSSGHTGTLVSDMYFGQLNEVYETTYIHAAAWLLTKQCVQTVGGFDPVYFHYGEDDDYLQRAKHFSFKVGLVPSSTVVHDGVYKSWAQLEWNENRNLVMELQHLKRMFPHFRTNVLSYFKKGFDELTTLLLFRKFRKFGFRFKIMWKTIMRMKTIYTSYKSSFKKGAFLN